MNLPTASLRALLLILSIAAGLNPAFSAAESGLDSLICRPIPEDKSGKSTQDARKIPVDRNHRLFNEPLVSLKKYGIAGSSAYAGKDGLNAPYYRCVCSEDEDLKLRKTAAQKLQKVNERLKPLGIELFVYDAYRPISCQKTLFNIFIDEARSSLGPSASQKELVDYARKFCADPTSFDAANPETWPNHMTGGAVDLGLRRRSTGEHLFMGSIYDDDSALSASSFFEYTKSDSGSDSGKDGTPQHAVKLIDSSSRREAVRNRRILYNAMQNEGFANYPQEWWHFDYGDQFWVQNSRARSETKAFYGPI